MSDLGQLQTIQFIDGWNSIHGDYHNTTNVNGEQCMNNTLIMRSRQFYLKIQINELDLTSLTSIQCQDHCEWIHNGMRHVILDSRSKE